MKADVLGDILKDGQLKIVGSVLDPQIKRLIVSAVTQYGARQGLSRSVFCSIFW